MSKTGYRQAIPPVKQDFGEYWERRQRLEMESRYMEQEGKLLSLLNGMSVEEARAFLRRHAWARWDFEEATNTFRLYATLFGEGYEKRYECAAFTILVVGTDLGQGHDA